MHISAFSDGDSDLTVWSGLCWGHSDAKRCSKAGAGVPREVSIPGRPGGGVESETADVGVEQKTKEGIRHRRGKREGQGVLQSLQLEKVSGDVHGNMQDRKKARLDGEA